MSVAGFSQHIVWIEDTLHYCFTEPQTRFVVKTIRHDSIHKAQIINLQQRIQADSIKISAFEARKSVTDTISKKKDDVIEVKEERLQLSKKQLRKEKWARVGDWFKSRWQIVVAASAGVGVGYGIASIPK